MKNKYWMIAIGGVFLGYIVFSIFLLFYGIRTIGGTSVFSKTNLKQASLEQTRLGSTSSATHKSSLDHSDQLWVKG